MSLGDKLKIVHVVGGLNRGGAELFVFNLISASKHIPINFVVLCYGKLKFDMEEDFKRLGVKTIRVSSSTSIFQILNVLRKEKPEVIHSHTGLNSGIITALAFVMLIPIRIVHSHTTNFDGNSKSILFRIYEFFALISIRHLSNLRLACGRDAGKALFNKKSFHFVPNGIVTANFKFSEELRRIARKELLRDSDSKSTLLIGMVARLQEVKNHTFVMKALSDFCIYHPNVKFVVVGNGPLKERLLQESKVLRIEQQTIFTGSRNDLDSLYNAFDVVVLPSFHEGFPVVAIEAQVNGVPLLLSDRIDESVAINQNVRMLGINAKDLGLWTKELSEIMGKPRRQLPSKDLDIFDVKHTSQQIYCLIEELGSKLGSVRNLDSLNMNYSDDSFSNS